jgi:type II secretory ATPase GspE/PulE/Tfp pilus assembly ATPase PilB-like protein/predicted transcriptional regulator
MKEAAREVPAQRGCAGPSPFAVRLRLNGEGKTMPERLFSTYQVADLLGATPGAVVEWIQKGLLPVQHLPNGPLRISESSLIQFLRNRGSDTEAEKVLARLAASPSGRDEAKTIEREQEMPRLDRPEPPRPPSARSETVEKMFPLDAETLQEVQTRLAPASAAGKTKGKPPRGRAPAKAPLQEEEAVEQIERWMQTEPEEKPIAEARPPEVVGEATPPTAVKEPELLEPAEREALLEQAEPLPPVGKPPAPQGDAILPPVLAAPPAPMGDELAAAEVRPSAALADESMEATMTLVRSALARRASEVHIESTASTLSIRLRIDGLLHDAARFDMRPLVQTAAQAMQQLLDLTGIRLTDARRPSRGQVDLLADGREVAVTVATCPTALGQRVVVSLRDSQLPSPGLSLLGLDDETERQLAGVLGSFSGLVLLVARPGSDRTQALGAIVSVMDAPTRSIVAIARKPAFSVAGLTPIVANPAADFAVWQAVRAAAEQDADAIVLETIPDEQTYPALLEAAQLGRLVVAATSAANIAEAVTTLLEMGLEPWPLAENLKAVVAYAPLRKLCPDCRQAAPPNPEVLTRLDLTVQNLGQTFVASIAGSCPRCGGIGYLGTIGCSSAMMMDKNLAAVIRRGPSRAELAEAVEESGARPLLQVGLDMVREGITSLEELARVLPL